ncbi:MAG: cation diffusion facilitator family transporter [Asticcacaulis sp.]
MAGSSKVVLAVTLSVTVAAVLVLAKAIVLALSGSLSILASLTDSGLDLIASLTTYFAVRYAKTPPDKEHPFGHGKAEAFSALFQAALVFASGALIVQDCIGHLMHPHPIRASSWALAVLGLSIVLTFALVTVQTRVLRDTSSVAVSADRAHYLTDLMTNIVALIGVAAAAMGFGIMDTIAGFVMAGWFLWCAVSVLREASGHLMDQAMDDDNVRRIRELVLAGGAVRGLHQLRTRVAGPYVLIQMHAELDPALTLVEAHEVIIAAENRLLDAYPNADILIHPDPQGMAEPHGGVFSESDAMEGGVMAKVASHEDAQ